MAAIRGHHGTQHSPVGAGRQEISSFTNNWNKIRRACANVARDEAAEQGTTPPTIGAAPARAGTRNPCFRAWQHEEMTRQLILSYGSDDAQLGVAATSQLPPAPAVPGNLVSLLTDGQPDLAQELHDSLQSSQLPAALAGEATPSTGPPAGHHAPHAAATTGPESPDGSEVST